MTTTLHVDLRELSGTDPAVKANPAGEIWIWPYRPYHFDNETDDYIVGSEILKVRLTNGIADIPMPSTPTGNGTQIQLRHVRGYGDPFLVSIPDQSTVNLGDLDHLDPKTLDPVAPPSPAWLAGLTAETTARTTADQTNATAAAAAQSTADSAVSGLGSKVNTSTYTTGLALKADATALTSGLALKQDSATLDASTATLSTSGGALDDAIATRVNEIGRAVDTANALQQLAANAYTPLTLAIAIPPTTRPVTLKWGAHLQVLTPGAGAIGVGISESTTGTLLECGMSWRGGTFVAGTYSSAQAFVGEKTLDASTTWRFYRLIGAVFQDSAPLVTAQVTASQQGGGAGQPGNRSPYMIAVYA